MIRGTGKMMRGTGEMMRGTGKMMRGTGEMMRGIGELMRSYKCIILPVPIHESDRSCICVLWVLILTLSLRLFFYMISELFRHCGILCFFHFILININIKSVDDLF
jgi:hypothetical protein